MRSIALRINGLKVTPIVYRSWGVYVIAYFLFNGQIVQAHNRKRAPLRIAFGKIIREKRLERKLSQEKLAEKADLHTNYVGSVERGERNIALENIVALAKALECSSKDLMPD